MWRRHAVDIHAIQHVEVWLWMIASEDSEAGGLCGNGPRFPKCDIIHCAFCADVWVGYCYNAKDVCGGGNGAPPPIGKPVSPAELVPIEPAIANTENSTLSQTTRGIDFCNELNACACYSNNKTGS